MSCTTGVISFARHCSDLPGSLSGPHDFDTSILYCNIKHNFQKHVDVEFWGLSTRKLGNIFPEWGVITD